MLPEEGKIKSQVWSGEGLGEGGAAHFEAGDGDGGVFSSRRRRQRRRSHTGPKEWRLERENRRYCRSANLHFHDIITGALRWRRHSPSLANDAEALLCLQRDTNSCGSMGSLHWETGLARSRGLCWPTAPELADNSWSLLTASREKVRPFSWKKEAFVRRGIKVGSATESNRWILMFAFVEKKGRSPKGRAGALYLNVDSLGCPSKGQHNDGDGSEYGPHGDQSVVLLGAFAWFFDCCCRARSCSVCAFPLCRGLLLSRSVTESRWPCDQTGVLQRGPKFFPRVNE